MRRSAQYKKDTNGNENAQKNGRSVGHSSHGMLFHRSHYRHLIRLLEAIILTGVIWAIFTAGHTLRQMQPVRSGLGSGQLQITTGSANLSVTITSLPNVGNLVPGDSVGAVLSVKNTGTVALEPTVEIASASPVLAQYVSVGLQTCVTGASCAAPSGPVAQNVLVSEPGNILTPGSTATLNVTISLSDNLPSTAEGTTSNINIVINGVQP